MTNIDEEPSSGYQFDQPIDILTTLDTLGIEHLEVSDERTIIIYDRTIINVEVADGRLHDVRTVYVDVFDLGPYGDTGSDSNSEVLIESLIKEIATAVVVSWDSL